MKSARYRNDREKRGSGYLAREVIASAHWHDSHGWQRINAVLDEGLDEPVRRAIPTARDQPEKGQHVRHRIAAVHKETNIPQIAVAGQMVGDSG
jgi:hypothetical protein